MQGKGKGAKADKARGGKSQGWAAARQGQERLRPGQLDRLVLGYMKKHKGELPLGPTTVARDQAFLGAVGNCLGRLEQTGEVQLIDKKPRRYDLAGSTK